MLHIKNYAAIFSSSLVYTRVIRVHDTSRWHCSQLSSYSAERYWCRCNIILGRSVAIPSAADNLPPSNPHENNIATVESTLKCVCVCVCVGYLISFWEKKTKRELTLLLFFVIVWFDIVSEREKENVARSHESRLEGCHTGGPHHFHRTTIAIRQLMLAGWEPETHEIVDLLSKNKKSILDLPICDGAPHLYCLRRWWWRALHLFITRLFPCYCSLRSDYPCLFFFLLKENCWNNL